jgi:Protein of unknown function (DUF2442)
VAGLLSREFCANFKKIRACFARSGRDFMISEDEFFLANQRARKRQKKTPSAVAARYDRQTGRIVVNLSSGVDILFSPRNAEGLENATATQLHPIEITPSGLGLHFPKLDADIYLPALLQGVLGSKKWMAARLGATGGASTSLAKRQASRANGRLGGRPKKAAAG